MTKCAHLHVGPLRVSAHGKCTCCNKTIHYDVVVKKNGAVELPKADMKRKPVTQGAGEYMCGLFIEKKPKDKITRKTDMKKSHKTSRSRAWQLAQE
jgi:hypothetical protein